MAGDWIKMRTDLYRDPKVCAIADCLMDKGSELSRCVHQNCQRDMTVTRNVMRNVTVGALVSTWGVLRRRGKRRGLDLFVRGMTLAVVDDISDLPGFGAAMASVGWLEQATNGLVFPRFFEEFNVDPNEEAAKKNAERQRRYRKKSREKSNVTVTLQSNARREKRREEKRRESTKVDSPYSPPCDFDAFWKLWPPKRRKSRGAAAKAWKEATAKISAASLLAAAAEYAASDEGRGDFVKMPSTWLNQECWNDDRAAWRAKIAGKASGVGQERNGHIDTLFESIKGREAFQGHPVRSGGPVVEVEFEG